MRASGNRGIRVVGDCYCLSKRFELSLKPLRQLYITIRSMRRHMQSLPQPFPQPFDNLVTALRRRSLPRHLLPLKSESSQDKSMSLPVRGLCRHHSPYHADCYSALHHQRRYFLSSCGFGSDFCDH